jgi:NAD(P)-dependent dehydrogenase (short-subunit alcohol dehydrogenase family)
MTNPLPLRNKTVLVTGAARRIGRALALACAESGADVMLHHNRSAAAAVEVQREINTRGRQAWVLEADFESAAEVAQLVEQASAIQRLDALVNSAAIFEDLSWSATELSDWERHFAINLRAPFQLSQAFARQVARDSVGRIVNILDWRALRPGADHFPYTISKAGLAALTRSLAVALAPNVVVNGLAPGAILPPSEGKPGPSLLRNVPAGQWGNPRDVQEALIFLLTGPTYITGEIIHVDGGRHLV